MEDLAEKDATEKSDAAREAFLAELALDSKNGSGGGNDNPKQIQEKMKDKKKNKDSRRSKDLKVCFLVTRLLILPCPQSFVAFLYTISVPILIT